MSAKISAALKESLDELDRQLQAEGAQEQFARLSAFREELSDGLAALYPIADGFSARGLRLLTLYLRATQSQELLLKRLGLPARLAVPQWITHLERAWAEQLARLREEDGYGD